jgi:hypothetical protein
MEETGVTEVEICGLTRHISLWVPLANAYLGQASRAKPFDAFAL